MENLYYVVFDIVPEFTIDGKGTYTLEKLGDFETREEAEEFIKSQQRRFGLTILEVWE